MSSACRYWKWATHIVSACTDQEEHLAELHCLGSLSEVDDVARRTLFLPLRTS